MSSPRTATQRATPSAGSLDAATRPLESSSSTKTFTTPAVNPDGSLVHAVPANFYSGASDGRELGDDDGNDDAEITCTNSGTAGITKPGEVDFRTLARKHEGFAKVLKKNGQVDFGDPESVKQLTLALALTNHALNLHLPPDRLCPPIPNRFNYILFLERLLSASRPLTPSEYLRSATATVTQPVNSTKGRNDGDDEEEIRGVDIGTGASAIYPLLALRQHANWRMLATEIDHESLACAKDNVKRNGLAGRCSVVEAQPPPQSATLGSSAEHEVEEEHNEINQRQYLFPYHQLLRLMTGAQSESDFPIKIDFTMTNPPFYTSSADLLASAALKKRPPNSACTGATVEMVYADGGEVGFVRRLVEESLLLHRQRGRGGRVRVQWWTSTLGKLSSVGAVVEILREMCGVGPEGGVTGADGKLKQHKNGKAKALNYVVAEFRQGSKTKRWAVGWSWEGWRYVLPLAEAAESQRDKKAVCFTVLGLEKRLHPPSTRTEWTVELPKSHTVSSDRRIGARPFADLLGHLIDEIVEELDDDDEDGSDADTAGRQSEATPRRNPKSGLSWRYIPAESAGIGVCMHGDCWSRKARRARERELTLQRERPQFGRAAADDADVEMGENDANGDNVDSEETEQKPELVFRVAVTPAQERAGAGPQEARVVVDWLFGFNAVLFESFCGWLRRKVRETLEA